MNITHATVINSTVFFSWISSLIIYGFFNAYPLIENGENMDYYRLATSSCGIFLIMLVDIHYYTSTTKRLLYWYIVIFANMIYLVITTILNIWALKCSWMLIGFRLIGFLIYGVYKHRPKTQIKLNDYEADDAMSDDEDPNIPYYFRPPVYSDY